MIDPNKAYVLVKAAQKGHSYMVERILYGLSQQEREEIMKSTGIDAIQKSAKHGHLEVMDILLDALPINLKNEQTFYNIAYSTFLDAASRGHGKIIERLIQLIVNSPHLDEIIHSDNDFAFVYIAWHGEILMLNKLVELTPDPNKRDEMIHANNDEAFRKVTERCNIEIFEKLLELTPDPVKRDDMIHAIDDEAFRRAASYGYIYIVEKLLELTPNPKKREIMIHAGDNEAFIYAAAAGLIPIVNLLLALTTNSIERMRMIHSRDNIVFYNIINNDHFYLLHKLLTIINDEENMEKIRHNFSDTLGDIVKKSHSLFVIYDLLELTPDSLKRDDMIKNWLKHLSILPNNNRDLAQLLIVTTPTITNTVLETPIFSSYTQKIESDRTILKQLSTLTYEAIIKFFKLKDYAIQIVNLVCAQKTITLNFDKIILDKILSYLEPANLDLTTTDRIGVFSAMSKITQNPKNNQSSESNFVDKVLQSRLLNKNLRQVG